EVVPHLKNFGALFVGEHAAEVLGDYSSGINHTLPTNSTARYRGGLSVLDFLKIQSTLRVSAEGFANIGPLAEQLAVTEGLGAHANAIAVRRQLLRG
ncbi:MAG: histidinol dehydrogenase, partial [Calditrichaeota bacterium]|nr:histidinol dehydrogenase [Calditrichota bacterium]